MNTALQFQSETPALKEIFSYMTACDDYATVNCIQIHNLYYINIFNYASLPIKQMKDKGRRLHWLNAMAMCSIEF